MVPWAILRHDMRHIFKHVAIVVAAAVLAFPTGFVAAVITAPFWDWFERTTGIESMGHGGPDDWVFYALFALCVIFFFAVLELAFQGERQLPSAPR